MHTLRELGGGVCGRSREPDMIKNRHLLDSEGQDHPVANFGPQDHFFTAPAAVSMSQQENAPHSKKAFVGAGLGHTAVEIGRAHV